MKSFLVKLWRTMTRPAVHISLGVLTMGGFIAGVIFWGGFNTALEHTNTEEFCVSCHTMRDNVYVELQERFTGKTLQVYVQLVLTVTFHMNGQQKLLVRCKHLKKYSLKYLVT